jgi:hypothetical protein
MADRIAVHRIIAGVDKDRKVIMPGTRFNTDEYGIDAEALEKFDKRGALREPRDQKEEDKEKAASPRAESRQGRVVEGRSGPADNVTTQSESEQESGSTRRRRTDHEL